MIDGLMSFKAKFAFHVESAAIDIAHNAGTTQILSLFEFICSGNCKAINNDGQNKGNHNLIDDNDINILKDLEKSHLNIQISGLMLLLK